MLARLVREQARRVERSHRRILVRPKPARRVVERERPLLEAHELELADEGAEVAVGAFGQGLERRVRRLEPLGRAHGGQALGDRGGGRLFKVLRSGAGSGGGRWGVRAHPRAAPPPPSPSSLTSSRTCARSGLSFWHHLSLAMQMTGTWWRWEEGGRGGRAAVDARARASPPLLPSSHLGRLDDARQLAHPPPVATGHAVHFVHDEHDTARAAVGAGERGVGRELAHRVGEPPAHPGRHLGVGLVARVGRVDFDRGAAQLAGEGEGGGGLADAGRAGEEDRLFGHVGDRLAPPFERGGGRRFAAQVNVVPGGGRGVGGRGFARAVDRALLSSSLSSRSYHVVSHWRSVFTAPGLPTRSEARDGR